MLYRVCGGRKVLITQWRTTKDAFETTNVGPATLSMEKTSCETKNAEAVYQGGIRQHTISGTNNWTLDRHTRALTLTTPTSLSKEHQTRAVKNRYVAFVVFHFANIAQYHPSLPPFPFSSVYRLINTFKCLLSISMSRYFAKSRPRLLLHLKFFCMIVFNLSICHLFH